MSSGDPEIDELLAPLRDGPIALSRADEVAAQRERLLRGLRQTVREVPERRAQARRRTMLWSAGAIAAAALLAFGVGHERLEGVRGATASINALQVEPLGHESAAWVGSDGLRRSIAAAGALEGSGELVAAAESWSRLSTPQGVRVELAPRTRLRVREDARDRRRAQLNLVEGEVHCDVPKLGSQAQFSIATPNARIIVHGTRFSVRVGVPDQPGTCVKVSEGLVEVRSGNQRKLLPPGTQWGCDAQNPRASARVASVEPGRNEARVQGPTAVPAAPAEELAASADQPERMQPAPRANARKAARLARARAAARRAADDNAEQRVRLSGTLAEENRLLAAALTAERGRDAERARELFEQLLARNPSSPLAPEARAGLARVR